jgi:hypothetical protein
MMAKFAEEDRLEQMNAQKRRMKQLEHQKAVQVCVCVGSLTSIPWSPNGL